MSREYEKEHRTVMEHAGGDGKDNALILLDIDDFKKVNDTYGHLRGNQMLFRLAVILREKAGIRYTPCRYGGEEFIIVMPQCGREEAVRLAEEIRVATACDKVLEELTESHFSISGGVACYKVGMTVDEWIRQADINLYTAKRCGKK